MKRGLFITAVLAVVAALMVAPAMAAEYHAGTSNLCSDCHTMHFSMQHNWDGTTPVPTDPAAGGNWLSSSGPNEFLLKAPVNQLCLSCHDGQTFAPDVLEANANSYVREAGALNESGTAPYETWKGHTLGSTVAPPGDAVGTYDPSTGLECTSCHVQHGSASRYRNLKAGSRDNPVPSYVISTTNDTAKDVWVNIASGYTGGSGNAATFGPYYSQGNVFFNKVTGHEALTAGATGASMSAFCSACHGDFHGSPGDTSVGGSLSAMEGFIRHPTAGAPIGLAASQNLGGHSSLSRFVGNTTKVKVTTSDYSGYTDASPNCVSCHKAHGNQNPFGLIFLNGNAATVTEEGGWKTGQAQTQEQGYRNLCGQCHGQGN